MQIEGPTFPYDPRILKDKIPSEHDLVGLDTEFTGLDYWDPDWRLRLVQIDAGHCTYVFDVQDPVQDEVVRGILENTNSFVSHNDADCISVKLHYDIDITDRNFDTLTLASMLWPRDKKEAHKDPFDLKSLVSKYVGPDLQAAEDALHVRFREILGKKPGAKLTDKQIAEGFKLIDTYDPAYIKYAAADAHYVRKLLMVLEAMMYEKDVHKAWPDECKTRAIATRMRIRGMQTNPGTLDSLLAEWGGRLSSARQQWETTYGCVAGSPKRAEVLLESGVKLTKRTAPSEKFPEGQWQLTAKVIEELTELYPDNEPLKLLTQVAENYNVATFLTTLKGYLDRDGIVHSSISTLGTVTGRWSVTQPAVQTVSGANPCRSVFVPRPGHVLVSADLGQIEPRVAVGLAEERNLIPDLISGIDVYSAAANAVFGPDYTPFQRKKIKRGILGTLYGSGEATLEKQAKYLDGWSDVTRAAIREVRNSWKRVAPAITEYAKYLQGLPIIKLGSGRYVPQDPDRLYKAINSACQGTARDELMTRLIKISERYDSYLVMTFHDELLADVPVAEVSEFCSYVRSIMEMGYAGIPTPTDIEIFPDCWGSAGMSLEDYLKEYSE
jgi:DNA polymerase-1